MQLDSNKSSGVDEVPTKFLKCICHILAPVLTSVINTSFLNGFFPDILKLAKVAPLFKDGDRTDMNNYRPISVLSSLSKIFERAIVITCDGGTV